ncbi:filamentous hemagglutinin N-terminal domain-containing protein [Chroococcus sp. FPU101]|uniref:filamentous hemagglutinin N-terminal domain-containing protein n=1 Tax=Chroococcus sp. FPU101 TaxID=1974212 RepID=UPI001A8E57BA|nr:filamentous hemagglutinin N-terminal domain-containing protein [Chroococcus sp. FPU101]GFE70825.1 filamentous hemagglutinin family outer membrane protein [Chroococcus sp. FPU101]
MKNSIYQWLRTIGFSYCLFNGVAVAQITSDQTVSTQVEAINSQGQIVITGGTQAGKNLFHSFNQFSISNGSTAYFDNSITIDNIISRVTGGQISQIDGIIKANGAANLFIINPMGFIFGPKAKLEIGGSFIASSASSIKFADGQEYGVNHPESPVLTVAVPIGLQFGQNPGSIINRSQSLPLNENNPPTQGKPQTFSGLRLKSDQTLALIGGNVTLENGNITVLPGRVELGSVGENSYVSLTPIEKGWQAGYQGVQNFLDVLVTRGSVIDASGSNGSVQIQGRQITFSESTQIGLVPSKDTRTGDLIINGSESVELISRKFFEQPETNVRTALFVQGANVDGGRVIINTKKFSVRDGAIINTETIGTGKGGDIIINASESAEIIGTGFNDSSILLTATSGSGQGGNIIINTPSLTLRDGGQIAADTVNYEEEDIVGDGTGGTIIIKAQNTVEISGKGIIPETNEEVISQISASSGDRVFELSGIGDGGSITIETDQLIIHDGAKISVESFQQPKDFDQPSGVAGLITIKANSILLDDQGQLNAIAENNNGNGGEINLTVSERLELRNNSSITAEAESGNGGNVNIDSRFVIAVPTENSDIVADAGQGNGGNIDITASGLFGFQIQQAPRIDLSEINASSRTGVSGLVTINRPDVDSQSNLATLPTEVINTDNLIVESCRTGVQTAGEFSIKGRGGLPVDPNQTVSQNQGLADLGNPSSQDHLNSTQVRTEQQPTELIVEAQGWMLNEQGQIILTAQATTVTPQPHNNPTKCSGP